MLIEPIPTHAMQQEQRMTAVFPLPAKACDVDLNQGTVPYMVVLVRKLQLVIVGERLVALDRRLCQGGGIRLVFMQLGLQCLVFLQGTNEASSW